MRAVLKIKAILKPVWEKKANIIAEISMVLAVGFIACAPISFANCEIKNSRFVFKVEGLEWFFVIMAMAGWIAIRLLTYEIIAKYQVLESDQKLNAENKSLSV
ncbi:MAG: hypothetical protein ABIG60_01110 [Patescibacteria group bacterium]